MSKYDTFINSWSGQRVLKTSSLDTVGYWKIKAADTNCDWGGAHYQADLGVVYGKLEDVIRYAILIPSFWSWGPGDIEVYAAPPLITKDSYIKEEEERLAKIAKLEAELAALKNQDN